MHLNSFQAYKLTAEQAIMQVLHFFYLKTFLKLFTRIKSLHVPRIPGLDGLSGFPNMGNLPYMEQVSFHQKSIWILFLSQNSFCKPNQTFRI